MSQPNSPITAPATEPPPQPPQGKAPGSNPGGLADMLREKAIQGIVVAGQARLGVGDIQIAKSATAADAMANKLTKKLETVMERLHKSDQKLHERRETLSNKLQLELFTGWLKLGSVKRRINQIGYSHGGRAESALQEKRRNYALKGKTRVQINVLWDEVATIHKRTFDRMVPALAQVENVETLLRMQRTTLAANDRIGIGISQSNIRTHILLLFDSITVRLGALDKTKLEKEAFAKSRSEHAGASKNLQTIEAAEGWYTKADQLVEKHMSSLDLAKAMFRVDFSLLQNKSIIKSAGMLEGTLQHAKSSTTLFSNTVRLVSESTINVSKTMQMVETSNMLAEMEVRQRWVAINAITETANLEAKAAKENASAAEIGDLPANADSGEVAPSPVEPPDIQSGANDAGNMPDLPDSKGDDTAEANHDPASVAKEAEDVKADADDSITKWKAPEGIQKLFSPNRNQPTTRQIKDEPKQQGESEEQDKEKGKSSAKDTKSPPKTESKPAPAPKPALPPQPKGGEPIKPGPVPKPDGKQEKELATAPKLEINKLIPKKEIKELEKESEAPKLPAKKIPVPIPPQKEQNAPAKPLKGQKPPEKTANAPTASPLPLANSPEQDKKKPEPETKPKASPDKIPPPQPNALPANQGVQPAPVANVAHEAAHSLVNQISSMQADEKPLEKQKGNPKQQKSVAPKTFRPVSVGKDNQENKQPDVDAGLLQRELVLQTGGGTAPPPDARNKLAGTLGFDPSIAKIHTGPAAVAASRHLNAKAFTIGKDVFFNEGQYDPYSKKGMGLLAHELTHVGQQTGRVGSQTRFYTPAGGDEMEEEAQQVAAMVLNTSQTGGGLAVGAFERTYVPEGDDPVNGSQRARLDQLGVKALREADKALKMESLPINVTISELNVDISLDLEELTDPEIIDLWKQAIMDAALSVKQPQIIGARPVAHIQKEGDLPLPGVPMSIEATPENIAEVLGTVKPAENASGLYTGVFSGHKFMLSHTDYEKIKSVGGKAVVEAAPYIKNKMEFEVGAVSEYHKALNDGVLSRALSYFVERACPYEDMVVMQGQANGLLEKAKSAAQGGDVSKALSLLKEAEIILKRMKAKAKYYMDGTEENAAELIKVLEYTRDACWITLGILATIATAGGAAAVGGATSTAFGVTVTTARAAQVISIGAPIVANLTQAGIATALGDKVDWVKVGVDSFVQVIIGMYGGKVASGVVGKRIAEGITKEIVEGVISNEAAAIVTTIINQLYDLCKDKDVTWGDTVNKLIDRLTDPKELFISILMGVVTAKAKGTYGKPKTGGAHEEGGQGGGKKSGGDDEGGGGKKSNSDDEGKKSSGDDEKKSSGGEDDAKKTPPKDDKAPENDPSGTGKPTSAKDSAYDVMSKKLKAGGAEAAKVARDLIKSVGDWKGQLKKMSSEGGVLGKEAQAPLDQARQAIISEAREPVLQKHPDIEASDVGSPGFGSDKDITLKPKPEVLENIKTPEDVAKYVEKSDQAVKDFNESLRGKLGGAESDAAIDTNIYSWTGAEVTLPVPQQQARAVAKAKDVMSLVEMRRGMEAGNPQNPEGAKKQWNEYKEQSLKEIAPDPNAKGAQAGMEKAAEAEMKRQFDAAEQKYSEIEANEKAAYDEVKKANPDLPEAALQNRAKEHAASKARQELAAELRKTPPDYAKIAELQAKVKISEPGAFASQDAIDDVVNDQQKTSRPDSKGGVVKTKPVTDSDALVRAAQSYYSQLCEHMHGTVMDRLKAVSKYGPRIDDAVRRALQGGKGNDPSNFTKRNTQENASKFGTDLGAPAAKDSAMVADVAAAAGRSPEEYSTVGPLSEPEFYRRQQLFEADAGTYINTKFNAAKSSIQGAKKTLMMKDAVNLPDPPAPPPPPPPPPPEKNSSTDPDGPGGKKSSNADDEPPPTVKVPKRSGPDPDEPPPSEKLPNNTTVAKDMAKMDAVPAGTIERHLSLGDATTTYESLISKDSSREALIMRNNKTGEHVVVQGGKSKVSATVIDANGKPVEKGIMDWDTLEHFHPGDDPSSRLPSTADFQNLKAKVEHLKSQNAEPGLMSEKLRYLNSKTNQPEFTEFGYNPANPQEPWFTTYNKRDGTRVTRTSAEPVEINNMPGHIDGPY